MPGRKCSVSYVDASGAKHTARVWADGLREACCLALAEFAKRRKDGDWGDPPGTATELVVEVVPPPVTHSVKVSDVMRWLDSTPTDPAKAVEKTRLKKMLAL
jgi:hypothetical protein